MTFVDRIKQRTKKSNTVQSIGINWVQMLNLEPQPTNSTRNLSRNFKDKNYCCLKNPNNVKYSISNFILFIKTVSCYLDLQCFFIVRKTSLIRVKQEE